MLLRGLFSQPMLPHPCHCIPPSHRCICVFNGSSHHKMLPHPWHCIHPSHRCICVFKVQGFFSPPMLPHPSHCIPPSHHCIGLFKGFSHHQCCHTLPLNSSLAPLYRPLQGHFSPPKLPHPATVFLPHTSITPMYRPRQALFAPQTLPHPFHRIPPSHQYHTNV